MDIFACLVTLAFIVLLAWMLWHKVLGTQASNEATFDLRAPVWPFYAIAWTGVVASALGALARLYMLAIGSPPEEHHWQTRVTADQEGL